MTKKQLKAVRRRNEKVTNHNFQKKTLAHVPTMADCITKKDVEAMEAQIRENAKRTIERRI